MKNQKLFFNCKTRSAININGIKNYTMIPLGHRCSSALAIQYASLRHMSLPFDWVLKLFPRKTWGKNRFSMFPIFLRVSGFPGESIFSAGFRRRFFFFDSTR